MQTLKSKKVIFWSIAFGLIILTGLLWKVWTTPHEKFRPAGELATLEVQQTDLLSLDADTRIYGPANVNATGTPAMTFFTAGSSATTTQILDTSLATLVDMDMTVAASSSASAFVRCISFSDNAIDWYQETGKQQDSITEQQQGKMCRTIIPGAAGTTTWNDTVTPVASPYMKIDYNFKDANGAFTVKAVLKKPYQ